MSLLRRASACLAACSLALPAQVLSQTASTQPAVAAASPTTSQIPLSHLYLHFFIYEAHLQQLEKQHPEVARAKTTFQEQLRLETGLSKDEWKQLTASSTKMEATHLDLFTQRAALARADRASCGAQPATCSAPPSAATIVGLRSQESQALTAEITTLERQLGPDATTKLHTYLQTDVRSKVRLVTPDQTASATQKAVIK